MFIYRVLIILWGVNKITKKLIRPWATSNNEVLDYLSRVPDRVEMVNHLLKMYCQMPFISQFPLLENLSKLGPGDPLLLQISLVLILQFTMEKVFYQFMLLKIWLDIN